MEQSLQERLSILKEAGMMDEGVEKTVHHIVHKLKKDGVQTVDETIGMFLTHLIAAINRAKNNEAIAEVDLALKEELQKNPFYGKVHSYFSELEEMSGIKLEESEEVYVGGYLCILLAQGKEEIQ